MKPQAPTVSHVPGASPVTFIGFISDWHGLLSTCKTTRNATILPVGVFGLRITLSSMSGVWEGSCGTVLVGTVVAPNGASVVGIFN